MAVDRKPKEDEYEICPFLGLQSDPGTALAYPSELNCCHHARPISPVDLSHQSLTCMTRTHQDCEQFNKPEGTQLPRELRLRLRKNRSRVWVVGLVFLLVLVLIGLAVWQAEPGGLLNPLASRPVVTEIPTIAEETSPVMLSAENTIVPEASLTIEFTASPTRRLIGGLETLIGYENGFLIHKVQVGESLELLARRYGTTVEAIKAINYHLPTPLPFDWYLVIPVNRVDVSEIPMFEVDMLAEDILVEDLAAQLSVDPVELEKYNNLDGNILLVSGEWILIPRNEEVVP